MSQRFVCIIGAQRCGTTYLYELLDEHPEIAMAKPKRPEPKYFLDESAVKLGREAYLQKFFSDAPATVNVFGEKGTSYIEFPEAGARVQQLFPDALAIVMLRNPVDRALSNYFFSVQNGLETRTLEEAFLEGKPAPTLKQNVSVSPFDYLGRGQYSSYLEPYMKRFAERMRVCIFEETVGNLSTIQSVYKWLNVDDRFVPAMINSTVNAGPDQYPDRVPEEVRKSLVLYYRDAIMRTEQLLNRKLDLWYDTI